MQYGLTFRAELQAANPWIVPELDSAFALIDGAWSKEHNADNTHAHITCFDLREQSRAQLLGYWSAVAWAPTNFAGNGTQTWTVTAPQQVTFSYTLVGKTMTVSLEIVNSSVDGVANTQLTAVIPGRFLATQQAGAAFWYSDNGTRGIGVVEVTPGSNVITFSKADLSNWTPSAGNTTVKATFSFEVQ